MKKRELIQLIVGLSYSTGYDHAEKMQELRQNQELALHRNYKDGIEVERKRIVELLDTYIAHEVTSGTIATGHIEAECNTCNIIALIKGEQK